MRLNEDTGRDQWNGMGGDNRHRVARRGQAGRTAVAILPIEGLAGVGDGEHGRSILPEGLVWRLAGWAGCQGSPARAVLRQGLLLVAFVTVLQLLGLVGRIPG
jgi:hypothetical protein